VNDLFSSMLTTQKQLIDAQRASLTALHGGLGVADGFLAMQDASRKALEANLAAWTAWARLWGAR
jgi:hypothetical protein